VGAGGEMNQALYAHMNNKRKMKKKKEKLRENMGQCESRKEVLKIVEQGFKEDLRIVKE
jgi:hypothetical protein